MAKSMSSSVVSCASDKRSMPRASSGETPMAARTGEATPDPDLQAEPAEAQMPISSRRTSAACASTPGKQMLDVLGAFSDGA